MTRMTETSWRLDHAVNLEHLSGMRCSWDAVAGLGCPARPEGVVTELGRLRWAGHALCAEHLHAVGLGPCPHRVATVVDPADPGAGTRCDTCGELLPLWSDVQADAQAGL